MRHHLSAAILVSGLLGNIASAVNIDLVTVGNRGNDGELSGVGAGGWGPDRVCGAVGYNYQISKYEVTAGQYTEFLKAVAKTDTYGLYNPKMWTHAYGCKIEQSGSAGSYTYSVAADRADRPVNFVSYWDACRFSNWLTNGQATGAQNGSTTEDGSYTLNGYTGTDGRTIQRQPGARWVVPSEDEWYKAAYHENNLAGYKDTYFDYPTSSDNAPSNVLGNPTDPGNNATFDPGELGHYTIGSPYWRTEVGAHENSDSPYGTFDQGGNVWEWNEAIVDQDATNTYRGLRGGAYSSSDDDLHASGRGNYNLPTFENNPSGFRVAEVPEPATLSLLALGGLPLARRRHRTA